MNANSRRILNRKIRTTESADANANGDGQTVNGQVPVRRLGQKVPTQSLDLSFSSRKNASQHPSIKGGTFGIAADKKLLST